MSRSKSDNELRKNILGRGKSMGKDSEEKRARRVHWLGHNEQEENTCKWGWTGRLGPVVPDL